MVSQWLIYRYENQPLSNPAHEIQTEVGEAVQETVQEQPAQTQDDGLTVNQPQVVVVDPLSGSTMVTSNNQESSADQTQTEAQSYQVDSDTSQEENSVETSGNEEEEADEKGEGEEADEKGEEENGAFGSTIPPSSTSSSELPGSFESSLPTEKGTDIADADNGYQVDNNYNIETSAEQDIVEKIKEIEEAEEKEIEAAGWADAMATTQVIAFIIIAMVAVVVIYVLYIARKKSKERRKEKEYRNLLQEDYDSDDDKAARKKRYG
ncbi:uncharacterized protein LOC134815459 [Bolinopsis microptera]|uniref:uncharacterized protein LOC134815459 n=1 Tax=Bolinopsis microptera TaxID=2820187 RepID=UPI003079952B